MQTVAFCEIKDYRRAVLKKHWPQVPCFTDVRTLSANALRFAGIESVDVICGGFPCQDISNAGKRAGITGERSNLWSEYARIICEIRPRYVVIENVSALLGRGLDTVLGSLAALGYDAEWHCVPASYVGAPHRRDRIWIVAYPERRSGGRGLCEGDALEYGPLIANGGALVAYAASAGFWHSCPLRSHAETSGRPTLTNRGWWDVEPRMGRVANGVPQRVERLSALGDSLVPQIAEMIGRAIMGAK